MKRVATTMPVIPVTISLLSGMRPKPARPLTCLFHLLLSLLFAAFYHAGGRGAAADGFDASAANQRQAAK
jgi:hypothetical protein